jgi:hypothetical protein
MTRKAGPYTIFFKVLLPISDVRWSKRRIASDRRRSTWTDYSSCVMTSKPAPPRGAGGAVGR